MSRVLLLDHDQTRQALPLDALADAVATALAATSRDESSTPPRIAVFAPGGLLGAMPGYVPGQGLAAKLVTVFADEGHSSHQGVVALFDESDGSLRALINADAVTATRTAACATVAFQALVPSQVERIAVIGAGAQATAQLELLKHIALPAQVVVASRSPERAASLAGLHQVGATPSIEEAVSGADVVFCCTDADRPVVLHDWLQPHAHVSSVGGSHGPELDPRTVQTGSLFVEWPGAVTSPPPAGAHELQGLDGNRAALVGSVLTGQHPGRTREDEITVFKSTGYAALDVAAAAVALQEATAAGLGTWIDL